MTSTTTELNNFSSRTAVAVVLRALWPQLPTNALPFDTKKLMNILYTDVRIAEKTSNNDYLVVCLGTEFLVGTTGENETLSFYDSKQVDSATGSDLRGMGLVII